MAKNTTSAELLKGLNGWRTLHDILRVAKEDELWELLRVEKEGKCRKHYLIRLYGRANKLRYEREFTELLA